MAAPSPASHPAHAIDPAARFGGLSRELERKNPLCPICGEPVMRSLPAQIAPFVRFRCGLPDDLEARSHLCESCEHVFLTPLLSDDEVRRLYDDYRGEIYNAQRIAQEADYADQIAIFKDRDGEHFERRRNFYDEFHADRFGQRGLIVDAGDEDGYFGRYAYPHADVVTLPRGETPPGVALPELLAAADALMMAHTLQCAPDPRQALGRLVHELRAGREAWVEVPVLYSGSLRASFETQAALFARGVRKYGPLQTLHENVAHFSVRSLRRLFREVGLSPVEVMRSDIGILAMLAYRVPEGAECGSSMPREPEAARHCAASGQHA